MSHTRLTTLLAALLAGCAPTSVEVLDGTLDARFWDDAPATADSSSEGALDAGPDPNVLALGPLRCEHDGLIELVEGMEVDCTFEVTGTAPRTVDFACADRDGNGLACDCSDTPLVSPCDASERAIPFEGRIIGSTEGLGGSAFTLVIEADDGTDTIERRYDVPVIVDDGINVSPEIVSIDCEGDTDYYIELAAPGLSRTCQVLLVDPDYNYNANGWRLDRIVGTVGDHGPAAGAYAGGVQYFDIRFTYQDTHGPGTSRYRLTVNDGVNPPVIRDLTVTFLAP